MGGVLAVGIAFTEALAYVNHSDPGASPELVQLEDAERPCTMLIHLILLPMLSKENERVP